MRKRILVYIPLILLSCAALKPKLDATDPEFVPYIKEFEQLVGFKAEGRVGFSTAPKNGVLATCYPSYFGWDVIVNLEYWLDLKPIQRKALITHELTHCVCFQGHEDREDDIGCHMSVMSTSNTPEYCVKKYWNDYQKEAKDKCQNSFLTRLLRKSIK